MVDFNTTIMAVAVVFTVLLAIVNIFQVIMTQKGVNPLAAEGAPKYVFLVLMLGMIALLIAHIVLAMGNDASGKDNMMILVSGILATVFAITTSGAFLMRDKLADKAQIVYFASLALLWICIIVHVVGRVQL